VAFFKGRSVSRPVNSAGKIPIYQYPGQLPTLGLNKFKNVDIKNDARNPFTVQRETEKLLVARERDREFKDFNKIEKEGLRVFEKTIQTRQNRAGVIREINAIKPNKYAKFGDGLNGQLAIANQSADETKEQGNKAKLNIFDEQDSNMLKHETLAKLGFEDKGLVQADSQSVSSKSSGTYALE
jgi:hypothetical protein